MNLVDSTSDIESLTKLFDENRDKYTEQLKNCLQIAEKIQVVSQRIILIDAATQTLHLFQDKARTVSYFISTANKGLGEVDGSSQTPSGLHIIKDKIGDNAPLTTVFQSREPRPDVPFNPNGETTQITSRILRLNGLEEGVNKGVNQQGQSVDSYTRYIYIHGTNQINDVGQAKSAGCIRMMPKDVADLYSRVDEKTLVYIFA